MDRLHTPRGRAATALGLTVCLVVAGSPLGSRAVAGAGKSASSKLDLSVQTPLGLQGSVGVGERTVLPFRIADRTGRKYGVQVEYGYDRNGDGIIADGSVAGQPSEYQRATQVRRDPRDTSRLRSSKKGGVATFRAHRDGAAHAFVWGASADLERVRILAGTQAVRDETGRTIPDVNYPGQILYTAARPGVRLRLRLIDPRRGTPQSEWRTTAAFSYDNSSTPTLRLDGVSYVDAQAGRVAFDWTGFDADSEDANGNGVLDVLALEDRNGNGRLDEVRLAVHFDYYRVSVGELVPQSPAELALLRWSPCTRAAGEGDADTGIVVTPMPHGGAATFVWDARTDLGLADDADGPYLVRATPYDETGNVGATVYLTAPVVLGSGQ